MTNFELKKVNSKFKWQAYHRIRRKELFDNSKHYDENHPDEFKAENEPILMFMQGEPVATVRLDKVGSGAVIIRLVAVRNDLQSKGVGIEFMRLIIEYVKNAGLHKVLVNVRITAVGYYEKFNFVEDPWNADELHGIAKNSVQMSLTF
jgi:predicted N-acetyltransferase YhbS